MGPTPRSAVLSALGQQFHEALVQREVAPNGVVPAPVLPVAVVRKVFHDIVVNAVQRLPLLGCILNRHRDECGVRVGRLDRLHLLVTLVSVGLARLDGSRGLGCLERLLQRQTDLSLAAVRVRRRSGGGALLRLCRGPDVSHL